MTRFVLLIGVSAAAIGLAKSATANDLGCQVALCLSNPGGPTQYAACVPPMVEFWKIISGFGSPPRCEAIGWNGHTKSHGHGAGKYYSTELPMATADGVTRTTRIDIHDPTPKPADPAD